MADTTRATGSPSSTSPTSTKDPGGRGSAPAHDPLGTVGDFLPWIAYWALVGSVAFRTTLLVAVLLAVGLLVVRRLTGQPWRTLSVGAVAVFVVLLALSLVVDEDFLERWLQPLANLGLLLVVLGGMALGRPFVLDYSRDSVSPAMARSRGFLWLNQRLTAIWAVAFGVMAASSFVPPIVEGDATFKEGGSTLSIIGYWIVPFAALGVAAAVTAVITKGFKDEAGDDEDRPGTGLTPLGSGTAGDGAGAEGHAGRVLAVQVPATTASDAALPITVSGAEGAVDLEVQLVDVFNRRFVSRASFSASDGRIDTSTDVPSSGPWTGTDLTAPIWSAEWDEEGPPQLFLPSWGPMHGTVTARSGGAVATQPFVRLGAASGVEVREVHGPGLVGRAFLPPSPSSVGVVLVGGSEGGIDSMSAMAALLASRGTAGLVVGLFGADGLPATLDAVPLEPLAEGAAWLVEHVHVAPGRLGAIGISRGAEAVLAAAAATDLPGFAPSVTLALSPGSVVWEALAEDGSATGRSSWTVAGEGLPFVGVDDVAIDRDLFRQALRRRDRHAPRLMHLRAAYEGGLRDPAAAAAAIPVEQIAGRLVLLAGEADALWPSTAMGQQVLGRRRDHGRTDDELTTFPGAGHLLRAPVVPVAPFTAGGIDLGGEPAGHAAAQAEVGRRLRELFSPNGRS